MRRFQYPIRTASSISALAAAVLLCAAPHFGEVRAQGTAAAPATAPAAALTIGGDVKTPLSLSLADLQHQPRTSLKATNEHQEGKEEVYGGVSLAALLKQAGAPQMRGATMATYVLVQGSDGYRVIFSLAELDEGFQDSEIIVADTMDGMPLGEKIGPLRLVAPHDKRPARWVRMLQSITVVTVTK